ncbi:MAG: DUF1573 domain-containing protein [Bacteroidota bacterium]
MKNLLLATLFLFMGIGFNATAQDTTKDAPNAETVALKETPAASWDADRHNFGEIPQGTPVTHSFTIKNLQADPLLIDNVRTTCGCTAPSWTKDPILPGEETTIEISFNAAKEGKFNKVVKVYLSGQKEPEFLIIQGEVLPKKG